MLTGDYDPETVYYFPSRELWATASQTMGPQDLAIVADGHHLLIPAGRTWWTEPVAPPASFGRGDADLYLYDHTTPRRLATPRYSAYVKIAEGCDHTCAFCVIPKLRGRFRSRSIHSLVEEARRLAAEGVREITLVSQDTTSFAVDLGVSDGLAQINKAAPAFAVVDLRLGDGNGLDVVSALKRKRPDARTIVLTGYGNIATAGPGGKLTYQVSARFSISRDGISRSSCG